MPPKGEKDKKERRKSGSKGTSSSKGSTAASSALFAKSMAPITVDDSVALSTTVAPFSLATWNVLADAHVYPHYYKHRTKEQLSWNERLPQLLKRVKELNPDILCMQEVDNWKDWEGPLKGYGYKNVYLARGGSKHDGCSISFKPDRFSIVDHMELRFDDIADLPFGDEQRIRKHCVALGLVLRPAEATGDELDFFVVTTHLFWNPKFEDVKIRQAILLMYHIQQFWTKGDRIVLCGDLNSTPDSAIATFFRTGHVDLRQWPLRRISGRGYGGKCTGYSVFGIAPKTDENTTETSSGSDNEGAENGEDGKESMDMELIDQTGDALSPKQLYKLLKCPVLSHGFRLRSAYQDRLISNTASSSSSSSKSKGKNSDGDRSHNGDFASDAIHEPITSHFQQFSGTLDYIFTSPGLYSTALLPLPTNSEIAEIGHLPVNGFASDHLILQAMLEFGVEKERS